MSYDSILEQLQTLHAILLDRNSRASREALWWADEAAADLSSAIEQLEYLLEWKEGKRSCPL